MDKSITRLSITMIITIILILVSIPLWNYSSGKKGALLAESYENLSVSVIVGEFSQLLIIEDNRALDNITPTKLSLRNRNSFKKDCELLMLVDKNSTVDYKYIHVAVEDKVYELKKLEMYQDKDNYYFVIGEYSIEEYTNVEVNVRVWLSEEIKELDDSMRLITNFITK